MGRIKRVKGKINLADYFIWEFMDTQFEDPSVRFHISRWLPKLIETGEFNYLRFLARHELIFQEKIFWKQVFYWKKLMFLGDRQAERFLQEVCLGFKQSLLVPLKKRGRLRKSIKVDDKEYLELQKQLTKSNILDFDHQILRDWRKTIKSTKNSKTKEQTRGMVQDTLASRKRNLTAFIKKQKITFSKKTIDKLVTKTNAKIALHIIAKKNHCSLVTIKWRLASEVPRWETRNVLGWEVPIRKKRTPRELDPSRKKTPKN